MTTFADALARRRQRGDSHVQLAAVLAQLLPGWRHDPTGSPRSMLHGPGGGRLLIDVLTTGPSHRASIIPKMPDDAPLLEHRRSKTITAALDRGPAAIARDITTRLLPAYLADLEEANTLREAQKDDRDRQRRRADDILALDPDCRERFAWTERPETLRLALPERHARHTDISLDLEERHSIHIDGIPYTLLRQLIDTYLQYDAASDDNR